MAEIRQATMFDISAIQACDLLCFPDEDPWDYFLYEEYIVFWPRLVYVAEDSVTGCIVGYVFAQVDGEGTENHGYIANLCVVPTHRKQGIAKELMDASQNALVQEYGSEYVSLHIRTTTLADIPEIAACDLVCFPSEDSSVCFSFFNDSILSPLKVVFVAEYGGRIVGYVVSMKLEEEDEAEEAAAEEEEDIQGYIDYLGVHPTCRKLGIAAKLMTAAQNALVQEYGCDCVYLHVRQSNYAAIDLYIKILGYIFHDTIAKFYVDGEDAYVMRKQLPGKQPDHLVLGFSHGGGCFWSKANAELLGLLDRLEIC
ncbi:hypothetical protein C5167_044988 [Papaver somniferum]|uniref:N-acetyltransferase domain-containing protein n=1 Tax=Papaver somniferum TaxID=3469 RepID=A0A4Y7LBZ5_PAPSO|nr:hypothetical protein C5167_044988 [Papaver somniferum]